MRLEQTEWNKMGLGKSVKYSQYGSQSTDSYVKEKSLLFTIGQYNFWPAENSRQSHIHTPRAEPRRHALTYHQSRRKGTLPLGICPNKSCLWANLHGFLRESIKAENPAFDATSPVDTLWSGYILKQSQEWYALQIISHRSPSSFGLRWCPHAPSNLPLPSNPIILPSQKNTSVAAIVWLYLPTSSSPHLLSSQNSYVET